MRTRSAIAGAIAVSLLLIHIDLPDSWAKSERQNLDVKVAIRGQRGCGAFADDAPVLVAVAAAQPGATSVPVALCLRNAGTIGGRLTMTAVQRLETETACSAGEAAVDTTCGSGVGELGPLLEHIVVRDRNCVGATKDPVVAGFVSLETSPVALYDTVGAGQVFCIIVSTRYPTPTSARELAAQTDQVTWRYRFRLDPP